MKAVRFLVTMLLLGILASLSASCIGGGGTTGIGWFSDDNTQDIITFRFNARSVNSPDTIDDFGSLQQDLRGQFELVDINTKTKINGNFDTSYVIRPTVNNSTLLTGTCTVNEIGIHTFIIGFIDKGQIGINTGDKISVWIDTNGFNSPPTYTGTIAGGKIEMHE